LDAQIKHIENYINTHKKERETTRKAAMTMFGTFLKNAK
jgi:hypothetical protein